MVVIGRLLTFLFVTFVIMVPICGAIMVIPLIGWIIGPGAFIWYLLHAIPWIFTGSVD